MVSCCLDRSSIFRSDSNDVFVISWSLVVLPVVIVVELLLLIFATDTIVVSDVLSLLFGLVLEDNDVPNVRILV